MHRVTGPDDISSFISYTFKQFREIISYLTRSHTYDQVQSAFFIVRVQRIDQFDQFILFHTWSDLTPDRILNTSEVFNMCFGQSSGPVTYPEHMCRTVIPFSRFGIFSGQSLFIVQKQCFMRSVECRHMKLRHCIGVQAAGSHELHG